MKTLNLLPRANRKLSRREANLIHFKNRFYQRVGYAISDENIEKLKSKIQKEGRVVGRRDGRSIFKVTWEGVELRIVVEPFNLELITVLE